MVSPAYHVPPMFHSKNSTPPFLSAVLRVLSSVVVFVSIRLGTFVFQIINGGGGGVVFAGGGVLTGFGSGGAGLRGGL